MPARATSSVAEKPTADTTEQEVVTRAPVTMFLDLETAWKEDFPRNLCVTAWERGEKENLQRTRCPSSYHTRKVGMSAADFVRPR